MPVVMTRVPQEQREEFAEVAALLDQSVAGLLREFIGTAISLYRPEIESAKAFKASQCEEIEEVVAARSADA